MPNSKPKPALESLSPDLKKEILEDSRSHAVSDRPMVIGIDGNEANVERRVGSNMVAWQLLHALHRLRTPYKWYIYLKAPPRDDLPGETANWQYRVIPLKRMWTQIRLPAELYFGSPKPEVFFSPGHYGPRWCPCPLVTTVMDTAYLDFPEYFKKDDLWQLTTWTERSVKRANHVITISQHSKNDIEKYYGKFDQDVTVAYPGIDHKHFYFPQSDQAIKNVKKKYSIKGDYILYVGTLQPRKNLPALIEAFGRICRPELVSGPADLNKKFEVTPRMLNPSADGQHDTKLVIAGKKGWLYDEIFNKVKELKLEDQVILTDYVPDADMPSLMAGARCLALVALYEGFGMPVVESLAVGTPAVVSNVSSLPEALGGAGYTVDPKNVDDIASKLKKILDLNEDDYYKLVDKGIKHASLFTWEHTAKAVLKALEHAAGLPT